MLAPKTFIYLFIYFPLKRLLQNTVTLSILFQACVGFFFFPQTEVTHPDAPALGMTADRSAQWSSTAATLTTTSSPKPPTVTQRSAPYTSAMVG